MSIDTLTARALELWETVQSWGTSPAFYAQLAAILGALLVAFLVAVLLRRRLPALESVPKTGPFVYVRTALHAFRRLLFLLATLLLLGVAVDVGTATVGQSWLVRAAQSLVLILILYQVITQFVTHPVMAGLFKWIAIPLATLRIFGWLDDVALYLDGVSVEVGAISVSMLALCRTLIFGTVLFWLGRVSNTFGKQVIRSRQGLDVGTREVMSKLFEIGLYVVIFLLLLGVMGINLTALAVFGGALGVGLGFGLQQIAANFISGIIILLDRSITPGDYIEFDDGRAGILRELNMRSATLETFDGKDVMVPNEQFITSSFVNWTHKNTKQRYSLEFSVAYDTDLPHMISVVRETVASHPKVLSGAQLPIEEQPDAEIASFGDSGVNILVEFWIDGMDDGKNRVGADLLMMIWNTLKEHAIEIPFPQRDVRIVRDVVQANAANATPSTSS